MSRLLRLDAIQLIRDRLALCVHAAGLIACLIAAITGIAWQKRIDAERAKVAIEADVYRAGERAAWMAASAGDPAAAAVLPTRLVTTLSLAVPSLADFTVGRSAVEPIAAAVRLSTRPDAMFTRYQVENPERLARGALDLSLVVIVIAPLLLIGLGYGVFTTDRDSGTARLWLAQAGTPLRLLAARSVNRLALVLLPILMAALILWLTGPAGRGGMILGWLGVAWLSVLFWWSLILLVNTLRITAETAALALVGLWTLLVFVAPVAIGSAAALINPPPSRFEVIAAARAAEVAATRSYDEDHPELSSATLEGRRASVEKGIEVRATIADAVAPYRTETDAQFAAQRVFGSRLALLAPPILAGDALASIAGSDAASYRAQREAAAAHLRPLGNALAAAVLGTRPINAASFDALPRFDPPPAPPAPMFPVLWLAFVTALLGGVALLRLRRVRPI